MRQGARRIGIAAALAALALACSASAAPAAGTLYTNNYEDPGSIAALTIGSDGLLTPLPGSPFPTAFTLPQSLAITPDGRQLVINHPFAGEEGLGIAPIGSDGTPSIGPTISAPTAGPPAVSPDGRFLYITDNDGAIRIFQLGPNGELTQVGTPVPAEGSESEPALTPDGHHLFLPEFKKGAVQRFAAQGDGTLVPLGSTPLPGLNPDAMRITPDGRFALLLSFDEATESADLRTFAIGVDGSLAPTGSSLPTTDAVPGLPEISPSGRFAYVANNNDESVTAYSIGETGALSQVGSPVPTGLNSSRGVAISVDGRFLYVEGHFGEQIQAFAIGPDGVPTKIGTPASTGGDSDGVTPLARPSAPVAAFTATPGPPNGATIFDASASGGSFAPIVAYNWDFGDGTTLSTATPQAAHVYKGPGAYPVKLAVVDANGCVSELIYTGQTAYCGGRSAAAVSVDTLPVIQGMRVTRAGKRKGKGKAKGKGKGGAEAYAARRKRPKPRRLAVHYKLSEPAKVTFSVERKLKRPRPKNCKVPSAKRLAALRPCFTRFRPIGSFPAQGKAGSNVRLLPTRIGGRRLKPGAYRLVAVATDSAGGRSAARTAGFRIKKPRKPKPRPPRR